MAEYIERERAKEHLIGDYAYAAAKMLDDIPTADVVEVVRCKDCKHFSSIDYNINKCEEHSDGWGDHTVYVGEDDYCSYGVKKEGVENE